MEARGVGSAFRGLALEAAAQVAIDQEAAAVAMSKLMTFQGHGPRV